ncbi:hypothetical protein ISS03_03610 [Patescibacteria group bacterium]|nr:hypothetical protein [Patescibacteria group bacterium]
MLESNRNEKEKNRPIDILTHNTNVIWIDHHEGTANIAEFLKNHGVTLVTSYSDAVKEAESSKTPTTKVDDKNLLSLDQHRHENLKDRTKGNFTDFTCTTALIEMLWNHSESNYEKWLALVAQVHDFGFIQNDFPLTYGFAKRLQGLITYYNYTTNISSIIYLIEVIAKGQDWMNGPDRFNGTWQIDYDNFCLLSEMSERAFLDNCKIVEIRSKAVLIGYASAILPLKDTIRMVIKRHQQQIDAVWVIFGPPVNNTLFFSSKMNNYNPVPFCEFMGGGGRESDGGFQLPFLVTKDNFTQAKEFFIKKIIELES